MGRSIFISYRRDDTEGEAGRLFDDLTRAFGQDAAFMDVDGIRPGVDFRQAIDENVSGCGVLLAMIGKQWLTVTDTEGNRRLDRESDYVRLEIAAALGRNIAVIPVLVHDAHMPHADQLPDNLKDLAYRNSVELTHARWNSDVALLIEALKPYVAPANPANTNPVHATVPAQLPPANPAPVSAPAERKRGGAMGWLAVAATVVVVVVGFILFFHRPPRPTPSPEPGNGAAAGQAAGVQAATTGADAHKESVSATGPATPARAAMDAARLVGAWRNPTPVGKKGIERLEIAKSGERLVMHAWGECKSGECDWGACTGTTAGQDLTCRYEIRNEPGDALPTRVATVAAHAEGGGLKVTVTSESTKHGGDVIHEFQFVPAQ